MDIYSFPTFNLNKILVSAEEAGAPYTLHLLDPQQGEHKSPEHMARHPLGKVPAVEIDGQCYFESNAICRYVAEKYAPKLIGDTPEQRLLTNQWVDFVTSHLGRWLQTVFFEERVGPAFFGAQTNQEAIEEATKFLAEQLPVLESQLQMHEFIAGAQITIADIVAAAFFETIEYSSVDLSAYPAVAAWADKMFARASYIRALSLLPGGTTFPQLK